jgi:zinc and cadmium transporter
MPNVWLYPILSVLIVSLISLVGVITFSIQSDKLKPWLLSMVSFSAGALLGDVFIHILPEISENGWDNNVGLWLLLGIIIFFILEKFVFWHHSHSEHMNNFIMIQHANCAERLFHGVWLWSVIYNYSNA